MLIEPSTTMVVRGGSFFNSPQYLIAPNRNKSIIIYYGHNLGFRLTRKVYVK